MKEGESRTKEIIRNAFITGFIFVATALFFSPVGLWSKILGVLAGICAGIFSGYLLCDFRKVIEKAPLAWKKSKKKGGKTLNVIIKAGKFLIKPNPALHLSIGVFCFNALVIFFTVYINSYADVVDKICSLILLSITTTLFFILLISIFMDHNLIYIKWNEPSNRDKAREDWEYLKLKNTYKNMFFLCPYSFLFFSKVFGLIALKLGEFFGWNLWKGVYQTICFLVFFLINLFILIHSKEKTIWTLNGILGGMIVYLYFVPSSITGWDRIFYCVCGGLAGSLLGIFNSEILSKKIFKRILKNNPAWH